MDEDFDEIPVEDRNFNYTAVVASIVVFEDKGAQQTNQVSDSISFQSAILMIFLNSFSEFLDISAMQI